MLTTLEISPKVNSIQLLLADDFLTKDVSIIKKVFQEMRQFKFEQTLEPLITKNPEKIHQFLLTNAAHPIKVSELNNFSA